MSTFSRVLDEKVLTLPLKEMDALLLERAIFLEVTKVNIESPGLFNYVALSKAIQLASYLHRNQTRANRRDMPRTHYIEHPLRNALRLLRYGVVDQNVIAAAILHDVVEDCLDELFEISLSTLEDPSDVEKREVAEVYLDRTVLYGVGRLVLGVSNPLPGGEKLTRVQKREAYVEHVQRVVRHPALALIKFADFVDNGVGLRHNDLPQYQEMVQHLAKKYYPLVRIFVDRMQQTDIRARVSGEGYELIIQHIIQGEKSLSRLLAQ